MTNEEAAKILNVFIELLESSGGRNLFIWDWYTAKDKYLEALNTAIEALKAEPCDTLKLDGMLEDAYEHGYQQARYDYEVQPCEDAVSREAVLTLKQTFHDNAGYETEYVDIEDIKALPPAIPKPTECEDAVSREFMYKLGAKCIAVRTENGELVAIAPIESLPPVTPKQRLCKDCKFFEYDQVDNVDGIPLIVAHEICDKWGDGCRTSEDGYCHLFKPKEGESE